MKDKWRNLTKPPLAVRKELNSWSERLEPQDYKDQKRRKLLEGLSADEIERWVVAGGTWEDLAAAKGAEAAAALAAASAPTLFSSGVFGAPAPAPAPVPAPIPAAARQPQWGAPPRPGASYGVPEPPLCSAVDDVNPADTDAFFAMSPADRCKLLLARLRCVLYTALVPIRPRSRGERRSLRTLPGASLRPGSLAFNPRRRRLATPSDAFQLHPDIASYGTTLSVVEAELRTTRVAWQSERARREDLELALETAREEATTSMRALAALSGDAATFARTVLGKDHGPGGGAAVGAKSAYEHALAGMMDVGDANAAAVRDALGSYTTAPAMSTAALRRQARESPAGRKPKPRKKPPREMDVNQRSKSGGGGGAPGGVTSRGGRGQRPPKSTPPNDPNDLVDISTDSDDSPGAGGGARGGGAQGESSTGGKFGRDTSNLGAFYTLVPIRPRSRGERDSLRTSPGASLRPHLAFNPRPRAPFNFN